MILQPFSRHSEHIDNNGYIYSYSSGIAVTSDGNKAFFLAKDNDSLVVCVIDVISRKIINQIKIGRQDSLDASGGVLSISPDGLKVYVPNQISKTISVIDARKEIVLYEIEGFEGADNYVPSAVALERSGKIGYVILQSPSEYNTFLFSFDLKAGASSTPRMVEYTSNSYLRQCAFNAIGSRVYAVDSINKILIEVDAATNQVVGQGVSGFSAQPGFIAITPLPYPKIAPTLDNAIKYFSPIKMQKGL